MSPESLNRAHAPTRRILLVDDHPMIRQGLVTLIEQEANWSVCGQADTGREALELADETDPDLAVVDLALEDIDGIDLIKDLAKRQPDLRILVLSMRDESLYAERALRAGAHGYIMKGQRPGTLRQALQRVLDGDVYLSEVMTGKLMRRLVDHDAEDATSPVAELSDREFQVFTMIGRGMGPSEIADRLHLSVKTIETYRAHIKQKLALEDAASLRRYAIEWAQEQEPA
jgi:DNA-binding NarL/FixJ family response regulator